eukprot:3725834-Alexandrium_andersonii.AAC.1
MSASSGQARALPRVPASQAGQQVAKSPTLPRSARVQLTGGAVARTGAGGSDHRRSLSAARCGTVPAYASVTFSMYIELPDTTTSVM